MPRLLVIGNSENRRTHLMADAASNVGWQFDHFSYLPLLTQYDDAVARLRRKVAQADMVRLDSPAENADVDRHLLAWGVAPAQAEARHVIASTDVFSHRFEHGQIVAPRQYYLGYAQLLRQLDASLQGVPWMNAPEDILCMFDKPSTVERLRASSIPVPLTLGVIAGFAELEKAMRQRQLNRVFVKVANGSSASGVIALHHDDQSTWALTSVETEVHPNGERRLFNSLNLQRYSGTVEVQTLIDSLANERLLAEQWVPKASEESGDVFDLRIVVIAGKPTHGVMRVSKSPMTNLHLGNRRGDYNALRTRLGPDRCAALDALCSKVAGVFGDSHYFGMDVMFSRNLQSMYVLEVNAYGDLLPNVLDEQGRTTHERELLAADIGK